MTRRAARFSPRSRRSWSRAASGARTSRLLPYSGRPAQRAAGGVVPLPGRADQPVLLHHEDDLLEPEQVRLQRRHIGEDQW